MALYNSIPSPIKYTFLRPKPLILLSSALRILAQRWGGGERGALGYFVQEHLRAEYMTFLVKINPTDASPSHHVPPALPRNYEILFDNRPATSVIIV